MVEAELKMVLVGGLQARAERAGSRSSSGACASPNGDGEPRSTTITLAARRSRAADAPHVLVSFEAARCGDSRAEAAATEIEMDQVSREQLRALEAELAYTKENLQAAIEELETSNEELQAANEELQASNEELQSTNEELQSVNEELYTVNAEYQRKIASSPS